MIWHGYPYSNLHELNLDWLLDEMKNLRDRVAKIEFPDTSVDSIYINALSLGIDNTGKNPIQNIPENSKIMFPTGTYKIESNLNVTNTELFGNNATFTGSGSLVANNAIIHGLDFDCTNSIQTIGVVGSTKIHDCTFKNSTPDAVLVAARNGICVVDNCVFDGQKINYFGVWADDVEGNDTSLHVTNSTFRNFKLNGIFSACGCVSVEKCTFTGNHVQTQPNGGGQIDIVEKNTPVAAQIKGCTFINPGSNAASAIESENANIAVIGNYVDARYGLYCVALQQNAHAFITENSFIPSEDVYFYLNDTSDAEFINNRYSRKTKICNYHTRQISFVDEPDIPNFFADETNGKDSVCLSPRAFTKNIAANEAVRIHYKGSGCLMLCVNSGSVAVYGFSGDNSGIGTLTKIGGELPADVTVQIFQYYIEIVSETAGTLEYKLM